MVGFATRLPGVLEKAGAYDYLSGASKTTSSYHSSKPVNIKITSTLNSQISVTDENLALPKGLKNKNDLD